MPVFYYNLVPEGLLDVEREQILYGIVLVAYHLTPPEAYLVLPIPPQGRLTTFRDTLQCSASPPQSRDHRPYTPKRYYQDRDTSAQQTR
jgi:hypothetical protein